jgi:hypothetical protein
MLDTQAAVLAAQRPFAIAVAGSTITPGQSLAADGRGSFASNNRTIVGYEWTAVDVTGATPTITNASTSQASVDVAATSRFTLRLTVTDDQGATDTADTTVATPPPPATPPTTSGNTGGPRVSGGGGGALGPAILIALSLLGLLRRVSRSAAPVTYRCRVSPRERRGIR